MTQDTSPQRQSITPIAITFSTGLAFGIAVGICGTNFWWNAAEKTVTQSGTVATANGLGEFDFYFPRPFASPPNLEVLPGGLPPGKVAIAHAGHPHTVKVTEQRADGFRLLVTEWVNGGDRPTYVARGIIAP